MSPKIKRKKSKKAKVGTYAVIATNNAKSEAFTKAREPKRLDSVCVDSEEEQEEEDAEVQPTTSRKNTEWDKVLVVLFYYFK